MTRNKYKNSKGESAKDINSDIFKLQSFFTDYESSAKSIPSQDEFRTQFAIALGKKESEVVQKEKNLFDDLQEFIEQESIANQWAYATCQCWKTFTNHLTKFSSKVSYPFFDENGINQFVRFLLITRNLEEKTVQKLTLFLGSRTDNEPINEPINADNLSIYELIKSDPTISKTKIAAKIGVSLSTVKRRVDELEDDGWLSKARWTK